MVGEKKIATGYIGNALRSAADNHTTTFADEIFDTERQKYQNEVNTELKATGNEIKADLEAETARAQEAELAITTELNSMIKNPKLEKGFYNSLGVYKENDKFSHVKISIRYGESITFNNLVNSEDTSLSNIFYDENNAIISTKLQYVTAGETVTYQVPENAYWLIINYNNYLIKETEPFIYKHVDKTIVDDINNLKTNNREILKCLYIGIQLESTIVAYINTNSTIIDGVGTNYKLAIFQVNAGETYRLISDTKWASHIALFGFSQSKESIAIGQTMNNCVFSYGVNDLGEKFVAGNIDTYLVVPEEASYIAVTYKTKVSLYRASISDNNIEELGNKIDETRTALTATKNELKTEINDTYFHSMGISEYVEGAFVNGLGELKEHSEYAYYVVQTIGYSKIIFVNGVDSGSGSVHTVQYDSNHNLIKAKFTGGDIGSTVELELEENCAYVVIGLLKRNKDIINVYRQPNNIAKTEWECIPFDYLFTIGNETRYSREYSQSVYFEGFLKNSVFRGRVNDMLRYMIYSPTVASDKVKKSIIHKIIINDINKKYISKTLNVTEYKTKIQNAQNKTVNYLVLADSLGDSVRNNLDGSIPTAGSFPSMIKEYSLMDNADISNISVNGIGTIKRSGTLSYKGSEIECISCDEARASRTLAGYLRHFCHCIATVTDAFEIGRLAGVDVWDSLGLGTLGGTREYVSYTGSEEQKELIRTTCHGFYEADYTENLFNRLKGSDMYRSDFPTLSFSTENCKLIMDYALEHPKFPFYSKEKVVETNGRYAFSISKMIERYRTLEDDGVTRVAEENKGTLVDDVNSYNICTPTHVIIHLGINDYYHYGADVEKIFSDRVLISEAIHSEYPNIIIGHAITRPTGVVYPEDWLQDGFLLNYYPTSKANQNRIILHEKMMEYLDTIDRQIENKEFYIPVFNTMSPYCSYDKYVTDVFDGSKKISSFGDTVHAGYVSEKSIALQILSWIYYTI